MNVALVIFRSDPTRGGAERYTQDLASALDRRGVRCTILSSDGSTKFDAHGFTRLARYARFCQSLEAHLQHQQYDIVHAMLPVTRCDVYHPHAGLAVRPRAKLLQFKRRRFAAVEEQLINSPRPPVVLCLSQYVKNQVQLAYPALSDAKRVTLFNGVDLKRFDPAGPTAVRQRFAIGADRVVGLIIAQDFARKGLAQAIKALAGVDPRLLLVVVGKENPAAYAAEARRLGVDQRVIFAGPTNDPRSFYKTADFFVLPTRHDPCSLVVLESLTMGVPVISTQQNGACEAMTDGVHGFVLPDGQDLNILKQAYQAMLDDARRRAMSHACFTLRASLSDEVHVQTLLGVYEEIKAGAGGIRRPR